MNRQLFILLIMADGNCNAKIVHYWSKKCHRVCCSVMGAEIYELVNVFNHTFLIRDTLKIDLNTHVALEAYVDSGTIFNVVAKDAKKRSGDCKYIHIGVKGKKLSRWAPPTRLDSRKMELSQRANNGTYRKLLVLRGIYEQEQYHFWPLGWATHARETKVAGMPRIYYSSTRDSREKKIDR